MDRSITTADVVLLSLHAVMMGISLNAAINVMLRPVWTEAWLWAGLAALFSAACFAAICLEDALHDANEFLLLRFILGISAVLGGFAGLAQAVAGLLVVYSLMPGVRPVDQSVDAALPFVVGALIYVLLAGALFFYLRLAGRTILLMLDVHHAATIDKVYWWRRSTDDDAADGHA